MARYLVAVGNLTPDEFDSFAEARASYFAQPYRRIWRNDEGDDGEHLDGLEEAERAALEPSDEDPPSRDWSEP